MNEQILWIWLSLACTPGTEHFHKLFLRFGGVERIYSASEAEISDTIGSKAADITALADKNLDKAKEIFEYCVGKNIGIINFSDPKFPSSLRAISDPPVLLYYRGVFPDFDDLFCVSVVGTRRLSEYGLKNAFSISRDLAGAGATIVSGMALGIDGVAHAGALSIGGRTIAVLGSGIDVCYPSDHKLLARQIVKNGCVITEYSPGTRPDGKNFPKRNRIISGLSAATLVIEGKERSGALITARYAQKQDRVVYALPGNVGNANSELTNLLIKNGAKLCVAADDIIRDFESASRGVLNPFKLSEIEKIDVYDALKQFCVSAVTQNDRVFKRSSKRKAEKAEEKADQNTVDIQKAEQREPSLDLQRAMEGFDGEALEIYKKIPQNGECSIESLVDSNHSLRKVMKALLALEMGRFIVMLPGEKVKRSL